MKKDIYILAGGSNALELSDEFQSELASKFFSDQYLATATGTANLALVAPSGTGISTAAQTYLTSLTSTIQNLLTANPDSQLSTLLWVQGEADAVSKDFDGIGSAYVEVFNDFFTQLKDDLKKIFDSRAAEIDNLKIEIISLFSDADEAVPSWEIVNGAFGELESLGKYDLYDIESVFGTPDTSDFEADGVTYSDAFQDRLMKDIISDFESVPHVMELEEKRWVNISSSGTQEVSVNINSSFNCAGIRAASANGEDTIKFNTSIDNWCISVHVDDENRFVFRTHTVAAGATEQLLMVDDIDNVETWSFLDKEYTTAFIRDQFDSA